MATLLPTTLDALVDAIAQAPAVRNALNNILLPHLRDVNHWRLVDPVTILCTPPHLPDPLFTKAYALAQASMEDKDTITSWRKRDDGTHPCIRYTGAKVCDTLPAWDPISSPTALHIFAEVWRREHVHLEKLLEEETQKLLAFIRDPKHWDPMERATTSFFIHDLRVQEWMTRDAIEARAQAQFTSTKHYLQFINHGDRRVRVFIRDEEKW
jgi:hypothetical protein